MLRIASESTPPFFIILDFTLLMIYSTDTLFVLFVTGSKAFKLDTVISSKYLLKDIPKFSSSDQTSLVEVLHKVLCPEAHALLLSGNESKVACHMLFVLNTILLALILYYFYYFLL